MFEFCTVCQRLLDIHVVSLSQVNVQDMLMIIFFLVNAKARYSMRFLFSFYIMHTDTKIKDIDKRTKNGGKKGNECEKATSKEFASSCGCVCTLHVCVSTIIRKWYSNDFDLSDSIKFSYMLDIRLYGKPIFGIIKTVVAGGILFEHLPQQKNQ